MEYNPNHVWDGSDRFSASLKSLELLGGKLGYRLVGANGVNAFFVKSELAQSLFPEPPTAENLYRVWGYARFVEFFSSGHPATQYIGNKYSTKRN